MNTTTKSPSPNRLLAAFVAQKARLLAALKDEGGLFECRFLARLIEREQTGVALAVAGAETIDGEVVALRRKTIGFLNDTTSPGRIDDRESADLLKDLRRLGVHAHHHAHRVETLT